MYLLMHGDENQVRFATDCFVFSASFVAVKALVDKLENEALSALAEREVLAAITDITALPFEAGNPRRLGEIKDWMQENIDATYDGGFARYWVARLGRLEQLYLDRQPDRDGADAMHDRAVQDLLQFYVEALTRVAQSRESDLIIPAVVQRINDPPLIGQAVGAESFYRSILEVHVPDRILGGTGVYDPEVLLSWWEIDRADEPDLEDFVVLLRQADDDEFVAYANTLRRLHGVEVILPPRRNVQHGTMREIMQFIRMTAMLELQAHVVRRQFPAAPSGE